VTSRKLRYIERKRLAETGSLGDFVHEEVPQAFRNALWYLVFKPESRSRKNMLAALDLECRHYFGWPGDVDISQFIAVAEVDGLLSFIEILIEFGRRSWDNSGYPPGSARHRTAFGLPQAEPRINDLCERHRFGYRFENDEARKIGSPALDAVIVGPALMAVQRPGWDQVEKSYKEALEHQRGGETDDAITAGRAAVEAALKAVGMTGQFGTMVKQFRNSSLVPSYLAGTPEALETLLALLDRSNAIRSTAGDAHGKASGTEEAPQALADLAIHWAGAFIVFLAEITR
jgi:Abortive infection C-terminus